MSYVSVWCFLVNLASRLIYSGQATLLEASHWPEWAAVVNVNEIKALFSIFSCVPTSYARYWQNNKSSATFKAESPLDYIVVVYTHLLS